MKKTGLLLGILASLALFAVPVVFAATLSTTPPKNFCSAKNVIQKKDGSCQCKRGMVWNGAKKQCTTKTIWCKGNEDKKSVYDVRKKQCVVRARIIPKPAPVDSKFDPSLACEAQRGILKNYSDDPNSFAFKKAEEAYFHGCMGKFTSVEGGQCTRHVADMMSYAKSTNELNRAIFLKAKNNYWVNCLGEKAEAPSPTPANGTLIEASIDDSDPMNGSSQFDFESGKTSTSFGIDLSIGGIIFESQWMPSVNWSVVLMGDTFENVKECPAEGYANVDDPDGDGYGSPRYANPGTVACLKTTEGNFVKLQVLEAKYDLEKEWRILKFKYLINTNGSRKF